MDKIEFTKDEILAVLNTLGEIPLKYAAALSQFFSSKLKQTETEVKEEKVTE